MFLSTVTFERSWCVSNFIEVCPAKLCMGYSITVSVRNQKLKKEMHQFLRQELMPWPEVVGDTNLTAGFTGPLIDEAIASGSKHVLGFGYNRVAGPEREYHYSLMRWVALKVGKTRRRFRSLSTLDQSVPYVVYDGHESWPILLESEWLEVAANLQNHVCDRFGMLTSKSIAAELAWYSIPNGAYDRITATHQNKPLEDIQAALVDAGLDGAQQMLQSIRRQLIRLDALWADR